MQVFGGDVKKGTREFLTIPSYKSTNISKPLEASSAHPPYVHNSWPRALVRRTKGLASNKAGEIESMNMLRRRFVSNFAPDEQLMMIDDDDGDKQKIITKTMNKHTNKENKVWACFALSSCDPRRREASHGKDKEMSI